MIFKKPYAFFIKYFKLINFILCILNVFLIHKLNLLHNAINSVYFGKLTNFSNIDSTYLGFIMYLLIFVISIIILIIILTLRKKKKHFKDYLFNLIYNVILIAYFLSLSNLFLELNNSVIEQTRLKLFSDISLLVIFPLIYFLIKYVLIVIGFSISKFNFQKDIIELKQTEEDNEEIELIFDKNSYKTKRKIRKVIRELKYYIIENKLVVYIILLVLLLIPLISLSSIKMFDKNSVSVGETFNAGNFSYKVTNVYETKLDSRNNIIKNDNKFVIVTVNVRNNFNLAESLDFKRIRLFYGDEYVYSNNFYNKYFYEYNPYNKQPLKSGENNVYAFIFKVPTNYKSNNYVLKVYDKVIYSEEEAMGTYKKIKINAKNIDNKQKEIDLNLNENTSLNKEVYGNSNLTVNEYSLINNYTYNNEEQTVIIRDSNVNNTLLMLQYSLYIDEELNIININSDKNFFENHVSLDYTINNIKKTYNEIKVVEIIDNKVFLGVPYNIKSADTINLNINFRNLKISYKLK